MKRKERLPFWLALAIIALVLAATLIYYINVLSNNFRKEVLQSLTEVSRQGVNAVQTEINGKMDLLIDLALVLDVDLKAEPEELIKQLQTELSPVAENNGFISMGVVLPDGTAYATNGQTYYAGKQKFFLEAMDGETLISGRILVDEEEEQYVNLYCTPILNKGTGEPEAVLFATYRTEKFRSMMEITSFDGEGYSYMVEKDGDVVIDSSHETSFVDMENVFRSMLNADDRNVECTKQLAHYMGNGESGSVIFRNKIDKYMYCIPVGINDWYLLTVVPVRIANYQFNVVVAGTAILVMILFILYVIVIWYIFKQHKKKQEELMTLAYVDPITGGHTLAKFQELYEETLKEYPDMKFAILNMDLNRFKMINDLYGYEEGDRILQNMDILWRKMFRQYEYCGHRTADRFVVLLTYDEREELEERIRTYRKRLQEMAKGRYKLSLRVGIYEIQEAREDFSTAFSRAMMAFTAAKNKGKHFFAFFDSEMEEKLVWEKYVEDYFQTALENHEFVVYYQAKIDAETGEISGAEALVRWIQADGTVISPKQFISVLESNGYIAELDRYMFREVCLHQKKWLESGRPIVPVSVNLSRVQMAERNFVDTYEEILKDVQLPPEYVALEFTESAMFDNEDILRDTVERLHKLGVKVLIDDFGVGYSSMTTLKVIPVDILKVDKSFIDGIGDERGDKIVAGMIEFALSLGMRVTAEGVETVHQYTFLRSHRCHDIQGYYFSQPIPADEYCKKYLGKMEAGN